MGTGQRWVLTAGAVALLLIVTSTGSQLLTLLSAAVLLVLGFVFFPQERARGTLAALVAACLAAGLVALIRLT